MDTAVADFNSVPAQQPPFRDLPSVLIGHLNRPDVNNPQPNWFEILQYFIGRQWGIENLQYLFIFIVRIALPNVIRRNRRYMLEMYTRFPIVRYECRLRYDSWTTPGPVQMPAIPPHLNIQGTGIPRTIMRSQPNPDGVDFTRWLQQRPNPIIQGMPVPTNLMIHRYTSIDSFLTYSEHAVRTAPLHPLLQMTIRALNIFWFISTRNAMFQHYRNKGWAGIESE